MSDIVLRVAAKGVVVNKEGKALILREAATYGDGTNVGRYHLPGGRLNPGERYMDGLHREIHEETGLEVEPGQPVYVGEWRPTIKGIPTQIIAIFTACTATTTDVQLSDEHDSFAWVDPANPGNYDLVDPDADVLTTYARQQSKTL